MYSASSTTSLPILFPLPVREGEILFPILFFFNVKNIVSE